MNVLFLVHFFETHLSNYYYYFKLFAIIILSFTILLASSMFVNSILETYTIFMCIFIVIFYFVILK